MAFDLAVRSELDRCAAGNATVRARPLPRDRLRGRLDDGPARTSRTATTGRRTRWSKASSPRVACLSCSLGAQTFCFRAPLRKLRIGIVDLVAKGPTRALY